MHYQEFAPAGILAAYVKCIWSLAADAVCVQEEYDKILPDGSAELIFNYGVPFEKRDANGSHRQESIFLHGQISKYIELRPVAQTGVIGVRFMPFGLAAFTSLPQNYVKDDECAIEHIFRNKEPYLAERISEAKSIACKVKIIEEFLIRNFLVDKKAATRNTLPGLEYAVNALKAGNSDISISQVAYRLNISTRELERRFKTHIGLSPKQLGKIFRFTKVLNKSGEISSLTEMAFLSGYYDQSHFIRDFREFSGVNPSAFFKQQGQLTGLFYEK